MGQYEPRDQGYGERVRASFARQGLMRAIGAQLAAVSPGEAEVTLAAHEDLTQQHGFLHAGIVTAALDNACGIAALTLMPPQTGVLTVEFKVNFLAPAQGTALRARGRVLRPGRTVTACAGDAYIAGPDGREELVATMLATMLTVRDRVDVVD